MGATHYRPAFPSRAFRRLPLLFLATLGLFNCDFFDIFPPEIEIVKPIENEFITYSRTLPCELRVTDNRKVARVIVFLGDKSVFEFTEPPFIADLDITEDTMGTRTFKVVAYDEAGNWAEDECQVNIVNPFGREVRTLIPVAQNAGDWFGWSLASSDNYLIVGSQAEDTWGADAGGAYVFQRIDANSWSEGILLLAYDGNAGDNFGISVDIDGDYAIVGAFGADDNGNDAGAAYVFQRTGANSWDTGTKLLPSEVTSGDYFGFTVGISGDYAIVGAYLNDTQGIDAGASYVFHRTGPNSWDAGTTLLAPDGTDGDVFGSFVAIDGDYVVVGAERDDSRGADAGAVYVFQRTEDNTWDSGIKLLAFDGAAGDRFGWSVAVGGDNIVVGSLYEDTQGENAGAVYVFQQTGTNSWDAGIKLLAPDGVADNLFGFSVDIKGDYVIVGAPEEKSRGINAGAAYVFHRSTVSVWESGTKLQGYFVSSRDYFGLSVAITSNHAFVGAPLEDTWGNNAGAVYVFR